MTKHLQDGISRICIGCNEPKLLSEFYYRFRKRDGSICFESRCKPCKLALQSEYSKTDHSKEMTREWLHTEAGRISSCKRIAVWQAKNKEKTKAHMIIYRAIKKNLLNRQPCRACGAPFGEAHHISYDDPYDIDWLCKPCHKRAHKMLKALA